MDDIASDKRKRLPSWLKKGLIDVESTRKVRRILSRLGLNTVCDSARCPNKGECYSKNTATFMILGDSCTRNCKFCSVDHSGGIVVDQNEPEKIAKAVQELGLRYVVITSVTRDDLSDGGAGHFVKCVQEIKNLSEDIVVEVLIPDFNGDKEALKKVLDSGISVLNHNVETVKALYDSVRPEANYYRSLDLLNFAKNHNPEIITKTGFMVGLGENIAQLEELLEELQLNNIDIVTIGQYIQPTKFNLVVDRYYTEEDFVFIKELALKKGLEHVVAGPLVRSSYNAFLCYQECSIS